MSDIDMLYCKVTTGPAFEACSAWWKRLGEANEAVEAIAKEIGATPGRRLTYGTLLEGFYRPGPPPLGWRSAGKKFTNYIKPNRRNKIGEKFYDRMDAIKIPGGEELAAALGFAPFFVASNGGHYCSAVGCHMRGGNFLLDYPAAFGLQMATKAGVESLKEWEYLRDLEISK